MNDKGKISELKQSSHRYQPSIAVGQKSESHDDCAFLIPTRRIRGSEMLFGKDSSYEEEKSRSDCVVSQLPETRPVKLVRFTKPSTRWQVSGSVHNKLMAANVCYQKYMNSYDTSRQVHRKRTRLTYNAFLSIYRGEIPQDFQITEKKLKVLDLTYFMSDEDDIHVNFTAFPNAAPIEVIKRAAKKEPRVVSPTPNGVDYFPQSGAVSPACSIAFQTAASTCAEKLAIAPSFSLALFRSKSEELLRVLEQNSEFVALFCLLIALYVAYRILTNLALLLTWWCGYTVSTMMRKTTPKQQPSFFDALFTPQSMSKRTSRLRKFRNMAPQAGNLDSDDGAAFKGIKPKKTKSSPKKTPSKTPVTSSPSPTKEELIPWTGMCAFGGAPKPKKDQSKHNGFLNGFGVGL